MSIGIMPTKTAELSGFLLACLVLCTAAVAALVTVVFMSLIIKFSVEYLEWLTTWRFI